jgi:predicted MFS family arabinose efflux permease
VTGVLTRFRESVALLATRRFRTFWFASLLSSIGTWTQQVAEPWLLLTIGGIGGLLGAAVLLSIVESVDRRKLNSGFAIAAGVVLILTALNPWFWGVPVLLFLAGACVTIGNTAASSFLQSSASPLVLGRIVSLYMLAMRGGISLGSLLTGATVSWLGVQRGLLINGAAAVVIQAALYYSDRRASIGSRNAAFLAG